MGELKILGFVYIGISMVLSIFNLTNKITGGVIGVAGSGLDSTFFSILSLAFLVVGLLFISRVGKGLVGLLLAGTTLTGIHKLNTVREEQYKTDIIVTAPSWTDLGKFQRTYRWDDELDRAERKYKIPKGLLKGLAMRESCGDPLKLNSGKDGGAGLFMFQPRTAKAYGLKVYGNSNKSSADHEHGTGLKKLIRKYKNNYEKLSEIDERFDVKKSAEAAARYLKDDFDKYHDWNKALSAYNQGKPAPEPEKTKHVSSVREYQEYYKKKDKH